MTETTDNFISYLRLVICINILLVICIGAVARWPINAKDVGSRPGKCLFFYSLLLLQCDFNINLMPYSVSPTLPLMMPRPPAPAAL